jgi:uncharacterized protein (DUF885 family)
VLERFVSDREALLRRYRVEYSPDRRAALRGFYSAWLTRLQGTQFDALSEEGKIDYLLLQNRLRYEQQRLAREEKALAEIAPLIPFADTIMRLEESRRQMAGIDPAATARMMARLAEQVDRVRESVEAGARADAANGGLRPTKIVAHRAAATIGELQRTMQGWYRFYDGYDPLFTWWVSAPYKKADSSLTRLAKVLREQVVGVKPGEDEPIIGLPIGRESIMEDLAVEMIPYPPEELITIARRDLAWSMGEMKRAAREMGFGDDWKAALEKVKTSYVEPGKQPALIRDLALEATDYVQRHDLVTVPPLARDVWRMEMLTPEQQKVSPFFLGGEVILVSFPTDAMAEDDKLMSLRGNNRHFARATVFHELIPGHHLQGFMTQRYFPYRRAYGTPFWLEGNAFYWETLLWDLGFTHTPEDRVGALFWRMHRSARIIFSLGFHLGQMTPQQAIDFLVDSIGHERANATAEVRRSFNGSYPPLYQVAYMLGGLQFRALHHELVDSGKMTNRQFHDAILQGGNMPVELVRARLTKQRLTRDYKPQWKFAEQLPPAKR